MDFQDCASAIDDSYSPIHFQPDPTAANPGSDGQRLTYEGYNVPRSGHWSVSNSIFGSAIDNRCPTVHQFPGTRVQDGGAIVLVGRQVQPIAGSVLKRLAKTTGAQEKIETTGKGADEDKKGAPISGKHSANHPEYAELSKGFYVPKTNDRRGIRILSKNGRNEVIKEPALPKTTSIGNYDATKPAKNSNVQQARTPSPQPSIKSEKARSIISHKSQKSTRAIRIVGKNGEEAFVEVPVIRASSRPASVAPSAPSQDEELANDQKKAVKEEKAGRARRDANAAQAATQIREERKHQQCYDQERAQTAKMVAAAVMSGARPASSNASAAPKKASVYSAKGSSKDSGVAFESRFNNTSKPPSVVSSKTSVTSVTKPASVRTVSHISMRTPSEPYKAPSSTGWKEVGVGEVRGAPSLGTSRQLAASAYSRQQPSILKESSDPTPVHSFHEIPGFEEIKPNTSEWAGGYISKIPIASNDNGWVAASPQEQHAVNQPAWAAVDHNPTVYAGRGWISPHPLSRPPSEVAKPESVIQIPSGNGTQTGGTMTYEEWKAVHQSAVTESIGSGRRNISRTSSNAQSHAARNWGVRVAQMPASVASSGSQGRRGKYQSPAVESVNSSCNASQHESQQFNARSRSRHSVQSWAIDGIGDQLDVPQQFDGTVESMVGSKVHLRMPWDGEW